MKKLFVSLFLIIVSYISMTYFVGRMTEKEIKSVLNSYQKGDISIELLNYQRHFFSATTEALVTIKADSENQFVLKVSSLIQHHPFQAVVKNEIKLQDELLAKKVEAYFGTSEWVQSQQKITLFSKVNGQLSLVAGSYQGGSESLLSKPLSVDYQVDIKAGKSKFSIVFGGALAQFSNTTINLQSLLFTANLEKLSTLTDYDYQLNVADIALQQGAQHSLLSGLSLKGASKQGKQLDTIDTKNVLAIKSYQVNVNDKRIFTDNRIELVVMGLYQPAFELIKNSEQNTQEIENALIELVNHGAQLSLPQLTSKTPWGKIDANLDLTLDKGAPLTNIIVNPYVLLDYISGDANLVLPRSLIDEPSLSEPIQLGLMTGFLEENEQTLNLQTSFLQGELTINGKVIPL